MGCGLGSLEIISKRFLRKKGMLHVKDRGI
jgi:hypothetical protein